MRRRVGLFLAVGVLLPLAMAAEASAQGATLTVTPQTTTAGSAVTVTGTGFNATNANVLGVDIRLSDRDSEPLANTNPSTSGTIGPIAVPLPANLAPGEYLLLGTQLSTRGRHTFGGPGRAKIRIVAAAGAAGAPAGRGPLDAPPGVIAGTILALLALTGGTALCVRRLRAHSDRTQPNLSGS